MTDTSGMAPGSITRTSALMGSPLYMSPEQMRASKDVDAQTDIWALGVILFELMTGRPAFIADSVTELAIKVTNDPAPAIRGFRPDVPIALEAIVFKCLEKDRRQRYRNVAELALALLPFAPKRAKGSVERISGIIHAAGLSASALAVPPSPQTAGTQVSEGTLPPFGRTTVGSTGRKAVVVGAGIASAVLGVVAVVGAAVLLLRAKAHHDDPSTAASPVSATVALAPPVNPPQAVEPKPADTAPAGEQEAEGGTGGQGPGGPRRPIAPHGRNPRILPSRLELPTRLSVPQRASARFGRATSVQENAPPRQGRTSF